MKFTPKAIERLKEAPKEAVTVAYLALAVSLIALTIAVFKGGTKHAK